MNTQFAFTLQGIDKKKLLQNAEQVVEALQPGYMNIQAEKSESTLIADTTITVFGNHEGQDPHFYISTPEGVKSLLTLPPNGYLLAEQAYDYLRGKEHKLTELPPADQLENIMLLASIQTQGRWRIEANPESFIESLLETANNAIKKPTKESYHAFAGTVIAAPIMSSSHTIYVHAENDISRLGTNKHHKNYLPQLSLRMNAYKRQ